MERYPENGAKTRRRGNHTWLKWQTNIFKVDPWAIIEEGFDPERNRTSESIFSLGNEYIGVWGYAEEGYSGDFLQGSYFNGLNEQLDIRNIIKGLFAR
ncbi:hypothetical protein [Paenibacillus pseudetheri]|nr:hypothetical protein [Paenibacillus pseudetheri]